jgi:hypothetical protein
MNGLTLEQISSRPPRRMVDLFALADRVIVY